MRPTRRHIIRTLVAVLVLGILIGPSIGSADNQTVRLLVKFMPGAAAAAQAHAFGAAGATEIGEIADLGVKIVTVPATRADAALQALQANPAVQFSEVDEVLQPQEVLPNDPYFPQQYALSGGAWGWYQTHTTQAWDITEGDPNVVLAVLDTGLRPSGITDFDGQIASTWNVLNNTTDVTSNAGVHGTYVAGAIGLAVGNGNGGAGYCPKCRLMIVQVGGDSGAYLSDIANGLTYAADHGARVANMSWAGTSTSSTLQNAINYAHSKGLVLTAAAGNSNCNCKTYPAGYSGVIAVGGTDNVGNKQGDSNYGSWVTLAAPEGTMTAIPSINGANPGYAPVGGTSLAAPVVAGIAGLLFSYDPSLSNAQVEQALEQTAAPVPFTVQYGRVDALAALMYLGATDPQPSSAPAQTDAARIYYELGTNTISIATLASAPQPGQVLVRGLGGWAGSAPLSVVGLQWQRCSLLGTGCTTVGNSSTYAVQAADAGYALKLVFSVKNGLGSTPASLLTLPVLDGTTTTSTTSTSTTTTTTTTTTPSASPPASTAPPTISGTAQVGSTLNASTGSWSGTPTGYAYQWRLCDSGGANCVPIAGATSASYAAANSDAGSTLRVVVTATNAGGSASAISTATATVTPTPTPPPPSTQTATFSDVLNPQNPSRSFTITVGAGTAHASLSFAKCSTLALALSNGSSTNGPSVVSIDSTLAAGSYTYTVSGGKCPFTLTVTAPAP